jgi:hypothetical protein
MKVLICLLFATSVWAQPPLGLTEEDLNPSSEDVLIKKPEKHLRHESMIYDFNSTLGIKDQRKFTGTDRNRLSIAGHINGNYEQLTDILGLEATYMRRSTKYDQMWYGAQVFQHRAFFDAITTNRTDGGSPNSEGSFQRPGDAKSMILAFGPGVGYRFKLLLDFFPTEDVFESVDVFVNILRQTESFIDETYQGYGLTTNYGIHKRSSTNYFYGGKLSYNLASVTRSARDEEKKKDRSLTLGWLSLAFELGFFY